MQVPQIGPRSFCSATLDDPLRYPISAQLHEISREDEYPKMRFTSAICEGVLNERDKSPSHSLSTVDADPSDPGQITGKPHLTAYGSDRSRHAVPDRGDLAIETASNEMARLDCTGGAG
jgi:hypothetical protein